MEKLVEAVTEELNRYLAWRYGVAMSRVARAARL